MRPSRNADEARQAADAFPTSKTGSIFIEHACGAEIGCRRDR
ncbi:hypothetical protein ASZ90_010155 [hydrocarbon metagenome]|uniref:Uncharacterized protein n=1 Tax=hydrocarbon metagenome TaxID=938273 RepID=A0A0W8FH83_9ZZZZ